MGNCSNAIHTIQVAMDIPNQHTIKEITLYAIWTDPLTPLLAGRAIRSVDSSAPEVVSATNDSEYPGESPPSLPLKWSTSMCTSGRTLFRTPRHACTTLPTYTCTYHAHRKIHGIKGVYFGHLRFISNKKSKGKHIIDVRTEERCRTCDGRRYFRWKGDTTNALYQSFVDDVYWL